MRSDLPTWVRGRNGRPQQEQKTPVPAFRSDQDLHRWLMWGRMAIPLTVLSIDGLLRLGLSFNYTPLATIPAILLYGFLRLRDRRRRKSGKRFISYNDEDLSW